MPKPKPETEYVSNNSFMTSQVKVPKPFGSDYEDPLEVLKAEQQKGENEISKAKSTTPTAPTIPSPSYNEKLNENSSIGEITIPTIPSSTIPTTPSKNLEPTSPTRDFQKVSNSITREAIPSGIFGSGKAKQLYDALYSLTRGAIKPIRVIRITKPRLMKLAGIGTRQTLWLNLEHLETVGLVRKNVLLGEHGGNEYEVFVPEELPELKTTPTIPTTPTSPTNRVYQEQNIEGVVGIESAPAAPSSQPITTVISGVPKTSFKDNTRNDDDLALALLRRTFDELTRKYTGKNLSANDQEKWRELAELLKMEFELAAARTSGISNVPAFLTEHLRRRLFNQRKPVESKKPNSPAGKNDRTTDPVRKQGSGPESLTEDGRKTTLETMRGHLNTSQDYYLTWEDFLEYENFYTPEDWEWLKENLEADNKQLSPIINGA